MTVIPETEPVLGGAEDIPGQASEMSIKHLVLCHSAVEFFEPDWSVGVD